VTAPDGPQGPPAAGRVVVAAKPGRPAPGVTRPKRPDGEPSTVWVFGDQLNAGIASLEGASPASTTILLVTSRAKQASKPWHRQRLHAVLAGMRRFADERRAEGFVVDHRHADTLADGLRAHREAFPRNLVRAMEPMSYDGLRLLADNDVEIVPSNQFLCHRRDFASWASGRPGRLLMEDFYRWQRVRLGYLMDGDEPAGGRWNYDHDNRERPPADGRSWPEPVLDELDDLDAEVLAALPPSAVGDDPTGWWATDRAGALRRLDAFIDQGLPRFGPHEDAMLAAEPKLAHSALSHALNLGLLHPAEVCDAVEDAYRSGRVPIASAEGFLRQVIGWREYVWGLYWLWMPDYRDANSLGAHRPLPPALRGGPTGMRCVSLAVEGIERRAWVHHIQRLMVLGNLGLLAGVEPAAMVEWMWASFVDGAEWVMLPNLLGMSLHADGGRMATKPYAGGGAYIHRMSDSCRGCRYRPGERVGERACPFTTLYWDFLARHETRFAANHRMARQVNAMQRLGDLDAVRARAQDVLELLDAGEL
jgi:deoxyribodipyrimidine photolyase-related protein